jgi:hypothetical protein
VNRSSLATTRCVECGRSVPITRAGRVRAHFTVPGVPVPGQLVCVASRTAVVFRAVPLSVSSAAAPGPARPPAALTRWSGPRRWEDADF